MSASDRSKGTDDCGYTLLELNPAHLILSYIFVPLPAFFQIVMPPRRRQLWSEAGCVRDRPRKLILHLD